MSYLRIVIEHHTGKLFIRLPTHRQVPVNLSDLTAIGSPVSVKGLPELLEVNLEKLPAPTAIIDGRQFSANAYYPLTQEAGPQKLDNIVQLYRVPDEIIKA